MFQTNKQIWILLDSQFFPQTKIIFLGFLLQFHKEPLEAGVRFPLLTSLSPVFHHQTFLQSGLRDFSKCLFSRRDDWVYF